MSGRYKAVPETTNNRRLVYVVIEFESPVDFNKSQTATGAESTYLRKLLNDWEKENGK